ncbi:hypothetical protein BAUCODRAFT_77748 [Baudoinia panamericana UAMH 10762]|uniref:CST complex subunit Ten1 n=1 Tax=Baudoinia panamericana (strain UAMH 10762) TaxID=717646 RepID=M2M7Z0_BAUPA|nr:uncharacterized protein BAUCODRAFT_77748 [Baudoinia panamericana UAMH 10762]EMC92451.1 hypothetical protein BAUCODRAFT_77748 [Baudoinia panamericana UAMH 10762]
MPEPSRLVKLGQLHQIDKGSKVRFLACVHNYDGQTARLTLKDRYPATSPGTPTAIVSIHGVIDGMNHELLETGAWLNVMGYVRSSPPDLVTSKPNRSKTARLTYIEATMIWSAGAIKLDVYQAAVTSLQETATIEPPD